MFCMVTFIATCIHFYAIGYMHDELTEVMDHEVTLSNGDSLHRPGRFPRFFQYLSLFCFSMLGLVLAGNIAMVFVFWELVGICSYFLIGFYIERQTRLDRGQQGVHRQSRRRFRHDHRPDGPLVHARHVLRSATSRGRRRRQDAPSRAFSASCGPAPSTPLVVPDSMVQADAKERSRHAAAARRSCAAASPRSCATKPASRRAWKA